MNELLNAIIECKAKGEIQKLLKNQTILQQEIDNDFPALRYAIEHDDRNAFVIAGAITSISPDPKNSLIPEELNAKLQTMYRSHMAPDVFYTGTGDNAVGIHIVPHLEEDEGNPARSSLLFSFERIRGGFRSSFASAGGDRPGIRERVLRAFMCGYKA